jgi:hypothetical protein
MITVKVTATIAIEFEVRQELAQPASLVYRTTWPLG